MALKLEHRCTRCNKTVTKEVQDVKAAVADEELTKKREIVLKDIAEFFESIDPTLLPDLYIARRGHKPVAQMFLCDEDDAKRSCADRVGVLVEECETFDPRKPKTKKTPAPATPPAK